MGYVKYKYFIRTCRAYKYHLDYTVIVFIITSSTSQVSRQVAYELQVQVRIFLELLYQYVQVQYLYSILYMQGCKHVKAKKKKAGTRNRKATR